MTPDELLRSAVAAREEATALAQRLDALLRALPVGVSFSEDPTCHKITGNPVLLEQFEISPTDNVSASAPDPAAPGRRVRYFQDGRELTDAELPLQRAVVENAVIPPMEIEAAMPSGRRWTMQATAAPVRDALGHVIAGVAITEDITEQKQAEAQLQLLGTSIARINDVVVITEAEPIDEPGPRIVFVNEAFVAMTGYSREEVIGKTPRILQGPDTVRSELDRIRAAMKRWQPVRAELCNYKKNGEKFWVEIDIAPVANARGWFTHWVAVQRDITERRAADEALRESRAKLAAALESMTDAVFISDTQGRFVEFNDAFATFHKFRDKQECAKTLAEYPVFLDVFMADGSLAPLEKWAVPRALRGEVGTEVEYGLRRTDTGETWVGSYSFAPIHDASGAIVGSVVVGRDITDRKQLEAEVLRIGEEERTRIAADLHDGICQELTGIQFFANRLRKELGEAGHPLAAVARQIEDAIGRTTQQTRQLARGMNPVVAEGTGLADALDHLAAATAREPDLRCSFTSARPVALADPVVANQLYRIAQEAVRNAVQHSHAREIRITLGESGGETVLAVRDDGRGLPAEAASAPGMGLRIMRYRANAIGARLAIQPRPGGGTEVVCHFSLPALRR